MDPRGWPGSQRLALSKSGLHGAFRVRPWIVMSLVLAGLTGPCRDLVSRHEDSLIFVMPAASEGPTGSGGLLLRQSGISVRYSQSRTASTLH